MAKEPSKTMTMPLPQILDELEDYIKRVEEATLRAEEATTEAHKAAGEARLAGIKAGKEAAKAAKEQISDVEDRLLNAIASLDGELSEVKKTATEALVKLTCLTIVQLWSLPSVLNTTRQ